LRAPENYLRSRPYQKSAAASDARRGETSQTVIPTFNRSLRVESRTDRLTGDPGAVLLREILERSGIVGWMTARLQDPRSQVDVTQDLASLIRTSLLLVAQGWRDHDDADALRHDPARRAGGKFLGGTRAIAFGNLRIKKVNVRRTFWLSRCVRSQVLMIFDPDATLQIQKRFPCRRD